VPPRRILISEARASGAAVSPGVSRYRFATAAENPCPGRTSGGRVDVRGWGDSVAFPGYGDLLMANGGGDDRQWYIASFSGTSSASPVVTGTAALVPAATTVPPEFHRRMVELVRAGREPEDRARQFEPSAQAIRNWLRQADRGDGRRQDGPDRRGAPEHRCPTSSPARSVGDLLASKGKRARQKAGSCLAEARRYPSDPKEETARRWIGAIATRRSAVDIRWDTI